MQLKRGARKGAGTEIAGNRWLRGYMAMDAGLQLLLHSEQRIQSGQSQVATSSIAWVNEKGCRIANPSH